MSFHLAHGSVVYRTTALHGFAAITMVERWVQDRWELAWEMPRDSEEITAEAVRERLGAEAADGPSMFSQPPDDRTSGGLDARAEQLGSMIDTTVAWLRANAVGSDTELGWARYQTADYDYELDVQTALHAAAALVSQMVRQRTDIVARNEMRRRKRAEEDD